jgi:hypothetical protein
LPKEHTLHRKNVNEIPGLGLSLRNTEKKKFEQVQAVREVIPLLVRELQCHK